MELQESQQKPKVIKRRKRKIDQVELIHYAQKKHLNGKPYTHKQIAEALNVSRGAVTKAISKLPPALLGSRDAAEYKALRIQIFQDMQRLILQYITPAKLRKASIIQLGTLFGIFYDKERLERGMSTENVASVNIHQIDPEAMKAIKEAIKVTTRKKLEKSIAEKDDAR